MDFGYRGAGTVGDTVFDDADGDAAFDSGEGLVGVDVVVTWYGPDGVSGGGDDVSVTSTANASGAWGVVGLPAGAVHIAVDGATLPAGLSVSVDPDGGADGVSDVTLAASATRLDQDFGYEGGGVIGDTVWSDTDGGGTKDSGEPGLGSVQVTLTHDVDLDGSCGPRAIDVVVGRRCVQLRRPGPRALPGDGHHAVRPDAHDATGGRRGVDGRDPLRRGLRLRTAGAAHVGLDRRPGVGRHRRRRHPGRRRAGPGRGDGVAGLDGDGDGTFETAVTSTVTDANGLYSFDHLPSGAYQVVVSVPSGRSATTPANVSVPVAAGDVITSVDVGLGLGARHGHHRRPGVGRRRRRRRARRRRDGP